MITSPAISMLVTAPCRRYISSHSFRWEGCRSNFDLIASYLFWKMVDPKREDDIDLIKHFCYIVTALCSLVRKRRRFRLGTFLDHSIIVKWSQLFGFFQFSSLPLLWAD